MDKYSILSYTTINIHKYRKIKFSKVDIGSHTLYFQSLKVNGKVNKYKVVLNYKYKIVHNIWLTAVIIPQLLTIALFCAKLL